ncbi:MAG: beta-ketoacyl synthase chain length factor [Odoribacteraceae bacterium]|jgi:3-oxoacyl-(acyl-carrier-protein) synthase|nr:beta-ketoacyl synthase chain length factor [Odoribacteraceae bacterium]
MQKDIYIRAACQISAQPPLSEEWLDAPVRYSEPYVRAMDPDYKRYLEPNVARRLGKLLKRAVLTARRVMEASGVACPDAIITGTGLGCIENTGVFLNALVREGEELLKPTSFMQSTHNTISSLIAIDARCHGYNSTYAHKGISFECALLDGYLQLKAGEASTVLVGAHDEMTPEYFVLLKRAGYLGGAPGGFGGETAVSMMLGRQRAGSLCRLRGVEIAYRPSADEAGRILNGLLQASRCSLDAVDAVMIGTNGHPRNDAVYAEMCPVLFPGKPLLRYKHLFGESYTAPGLGVYAAATVLHRQRIPGHLFVHAPGEAPRNIHNILFYNQFEGKNHSFILLSSCGE